MAKSNQLSCPVCNQTGSWDKIVEHLAMADDPGHQKWRTTHKLPAKITAANLAKHQADIRSAVMKES